MRKRNVGNFKEEITLTNNRDEMDARRGLIPRAKVRSVTIKAVPDTGATRLVISEELRQTLGLSIVERRRASFANGTTGRCGLTEPVSIRWKDRGAICQAAVIRGARKVLLGAIPLEGMDLIVDPVNLRLTGAHDDIEEEIYYCR
jgi:hypothetical protein